MSPDSRELTVNRLQMGLGRPAMAKKTPKKPEEMSDEEILAQFAREKAARDLLVAEAKANLAKYGTTLPPLPVELPKVAEKPAALDAGVTRIAPRTKRKIDPRWFKVLKTCPHCGEEKNVGKDFGIVVRRGLESAAGWCRRCRNKTNYKNRPRKNQVGG